MPFPSRSFQMAPSLLSADFSKLGEEVRALSPFADRIHLDVMDGHFVPNITFGPGVISSLRSLTSLPFDVHLMITPVDPFVEAFVEAGADVLIIHPETSADPLATLAKIKALGCKAGVALTPETPISILPPLLECLDLVLVMTVNPGFGGQSFMADQVEKIKAVRMLLDRVDRPILLEVDGGISPTTAPLVLEAGADVLVAGHAIFKDGPDQYEHNIQAFRSL